MTSIEVEPIYQCDCEACGKELFDTTPRKSYYVCTRCEEREFSESPKGRMEAAAELADYILSRKAWKAS